jgi:hypothetical protein
MDSIKKIKYATSSFDVDEMRMGDKVVYEFLTDGRMIHKIISAGSRKCISKQVLHMQESDFHMLCAKLQECISSADSNNQYIDD